MNNQKYFSKFDFQMLEICIFLNCWWVSYVLLFKTNAFHSFTAFKVKYLHIKEKEKQTSEILFIFNCLMSLTGFCRSTLHYAFKEVDGFIIMQNFRISSHLSSCSYITDSTKWNGILLHFIPFQAQKKIKYEVWNTLNHVNTHV
jgi:hypothetical protein